jgi:transcriptional regulator with XRE-family HTH domain
VRSQQLTFENLRQLIEKLDAGPSCANLVSALNGFMKERCFGPRDVVGTTLRASYYKVLRLHLDAIARHATPEYVSNRKSFLGRCRLRVAEFDRAIARQTGTPPPFLVELRRPFEMGASVSATARAIGMSVATLRRWLAGTPPQRSRMKYLTLLERLFGMPENFLVELAFAGRGSRGYEPRDLSIQHRQELAEETKDHYVLHPSKCIDIYRVQWTALFLDRSERLTWKTASSEDLRSNKRRKKQIARWGLSPLDPGESAEGRWYDVLDGRKSTTALIAFKRIGSFIGYLERSPEKGGRGWAPERAQTLANLVDRELLRDYAEWRQQRKKGRVTRTLTDFLTLAKSLVCAKGGFLPRHPEIGLTVGCSSDSKWIERCELAEEFLDEMRVDLLEMVQNSRDTMLAIQAILDLPNPLEGIVEGVRRMEVSRPSGGGIPEARWERDRLLFLLPASVPLRSHNLKRLTFRDDGTGHVQRDSYGAWSIHIARQNMKNPKQNDFRARISPVLWPILERYMRDYRRQLASHGNDYVYPSRRTAVGPWNGLDARFRKLSRRYLPNCPGVGPHCMRSIVATSVKRQSGSLAAAADALGDTEGTTDKHYVHDDGFASARLLNDLISGPDVEDPGDIAD